jgi:hypothetical protein
MVLIVPVGARAPCAVVAKGLDKEWLSTPGAEGFMLFPLARFRFSFIVQFVG